MEKLEFYINKMKCEEFDFMIYVSIINDQNMVLLKERSSNSTIDPLRWDYFILEFSLIRIKNRNIEKGIKDIIKKIKNYFGIKLNYKNRKLIYCSLNMQECIFLFKENIDINKIKQKYTDFNFIYVSKEKLIEMKKNDEIVRSHPRIEDRYLLSIIENI